MPRDCTHFRDRSIVRPLGWSPLAIASYFTVAGPVSVDRIRLFAIAYIASTLQTLLPIRVLELVELGAVSAAFAFAAMHARAPFDAIFAATLGFVWFAICGRLFRLSLLLVMFAYVPAIFAFWLGHANTQTMWIGGFSCLGSIVAMVTNRDFGA